MWEWVGPQSGLLVHSKKKPSYVDGSMLFGTRTFGKNWNHGYEPLQEVDTNKDQLISGSELDVLWIWLDANTNAEVDAGEINPASNYVQQISTTHESDEYTNTWNNNGAVLLDGRGVATWDWWSIGENPYMVFNPQEAAPYNEAGPVIVPLVNQTDTHIYRYHIDGVGTGFLRFISQGDDTYVISMPEERRGVTYTGNQAVAGKVTKTPSGEVTWLFGDTLYKGGETQKVKISAGGKILEGQASIDVNGKSETGYNWVAAIVTQGFENPVYRKISNISPEQFFIGINQAGRKQSTPVLVDGFSPWSKFDPGASPPTNAPYPFTQNVNLASNAN